MLKKYRLEHHLKQEEMAKLLNISVGSYSLYETKKREMSYTTLIAFLKLRNEKNDKNLIEILENVKKSV